MRTPYDNFHFFRIQLVELIAESAVAVAPERIRFISPRNMSMSIGCYILFIGV